MYSVFLPADLPECMDNNVVHLLHFGLQFVTLGGLGPGVLPDLFPVASGKEFCPLFFWKMCKYSCQKIAHKLSEGNKNYRVCAKKK